MHVHLPGTIWYQYNKSRLFEIWSDEITITIVPEKYYSFDTGIVTHAAHLYSIKFMIPSIIPNKYEHSRGTLHTHCLKRVMDIYYCMDTGISESR